MSPLIKAGLEDPSGCLAVLLGSALLLALTFAVLPALALAFDIALILLVAAAGVVARVLFRRPWVVEAHEEGRVGERREWLVIGWRASGRVIEEVAVALESGLPLETISPTAAVGPAG